LSTQANDPPPGALPQAGVEMPPQVPITHREVLCEQRYPLPYPVPVAEQSASEVQGWHVALLHTSPLPQVDATLQEQPVAAVQGAPLEPPPQAAARGATMRTVMTRALQIILRRRAGDMVSPWRP
jgi:hypothetical protein